MTRLSNELNSTYLPYGVHREEAASRQMAQDRNAAKAAASSAAARAGFKASKQYRNSGWDLVDAVSEEKVELEELPKEQLPEAMRALDGPARVKYVAEMAKKRAAIQAEIRKLSDARDAYLAKERKRLAAEAPAEARAAAAPLAEAVGKAIKAQTSE